MIKVSDINSYLERICPKSLSYDFDNAGIQIANPETTVSKVLLCLDVTDNVINEAINKKVNLKDIDFYKVPHHGSYDGVNKQFLTELAPKNAIISVGAGNIYNHPSTQTLLTLQTINPSVNIYRTDVMGNILINFDKNGNCVIKTQIEKPL